jgi:hypothetical protein
MSLLTAIKQKFETGRVFISPDDINLAKTAHVNSNLLLKIIKPYAKHDEEIKLALCPHKEGGYIIIIQSVFERDPYAWSAVSPLIVEEVPE